jgi:hypothetical protein
VTVTVQPHEGQIRRSAGLIPWTGEDNSTGRAVILHFDGTSWNRVATPGFSTSCGADHDRMTGLHSHPARPTLTLYQADELLQLALVEVGDGPERHP